MARGGGGRRGSRRRSAGRWLRRPGSAARAASPPAPVGASLERRLRQRLGRPVAVQITDNVHTMISFGRREGALVVRLHHMFVPAPREVIDALAGYVAGGGHEASRTLDAFIERHRHHIRRIPPHERRRRLSLRPRGRHHDLAAILAELNARHFGGRLDCAITWGAPPRTRLPRQSIKLGSYSEDARLIRLHPALDQRHVPRFFVAWIVFHELLHHVHGARLEGGRRRVHTEAFLEDERRYPDHERARDWERDHLDELLAWPTEEERARAFRSCGRRARMAPSAAEEDPWPSVPPS